MSSKTKLACSVLILVLFFGLYRLFTYGDFMSLIVGLLGNLLFDLILWFFVIPIRNQELEEDSSAKMIDNLIRHICSQVPDKGFINEAFKILKVKGWLKDGSLNGKSFAWGHLENQNLFESSLVGVDFVGANLTSCNFEGSDLRNCRFGLGYTRNAGFLNCDLRGSELSGDFSGVDLRRADLTGAKISGNNLRKAYFDTETVLPDGERWSKIEDVLPFDDDWNTEEDAKYFREMEELEKWEKMKKMD